MIFAFLPDTSDGREHVNLWMDPSVNSVKS